MEMLKRSVIVAAHPDDENLWFSSILGKVDKIVLCFLPIPGNSTITEGRRKSLASYPLGNVSCLELAEAGVFWGVDWTRPLRTEYGLKITNKELLEKNYSDNFGALKEQLRGQLKGCENVFTHNPWGEYGHVEHVQVYRAVKALQQELQFNIWFSNYASNKSAGLMAVVLAEHDLQSVTLQTDKALAERIADIYKSNGCWTWYDDYAWCDSEAFIKDDQGVGEIPPYGTTVAINFIRIRTPPAQVSPLRKRIARIRRRLRLTSA